MLTAFIRRGITFGGKSRNTSPRKLSLAVTRELSAVCPELECLQTENARLREDRPEQATKIDRVAKTEQLKELYAQALQDIQAMEEQIIASQSDLEATQEQLTLPEATVQEWQARCKSDV